MYVDNEASIAAFGESYFGVARGSRHVLYVSAGVGIGGGLVLDGRILRGASGFAGEVGHMTIDRKVSHAIAAIGAVGKRWHPSLPCFGAFMTKLPKAKCHRWRVSQIASVKALTFPMVVRAAEEGDQVACQALAETGKYLGIGLANLINALNPEMVVFGGILSLAKEFLLPTIQQTINERALRWASRSTQVVVAAYGSDACVMGAVATVYDYILREPFSSLRVAV